MVLNLQLQYISWWGC